jgi:hypothetical protein
MPRLRSRAAATAALVLAIGMRLLSSAEYGDPCSILH